MLHARIPAQTPHVPLVSVTLEYIGLLLMYVTVDLGFILMVQNVMYASHSAIVAMLTHRIALYVYRIQL